VITVCALHDDGLGDGDMPPAVAAQLALTLVDPAVRAELLALPERYRVADDLAEPLAVVVAATERDASTVR
jgi:hypothetical protein